MSTWHVHEPSLQFDCPYDLFYLHSTHLERTVCVSSQVLNTCMCYTLTVPYRVAFTVPLALTLAAYLVSRPFPRMSHTVLL